MRITEEAEAADQSSSAEEVSSEAEEAEASAVAASEAVWEAAVEPVQDSKASLPAPLP